MNDRRLRIRRGLYWFSIIAQASAHAMWLLVALAAGQPPNAPSPNAPSPNAPSPNESDREVVVYAALDREFSEPILKQFEQATGIRVRSNFDIESTKTVGLTTRLLNEAANPQCDVFWNNEMLHTLRLAREGVLDKYVSPEAARFPEAYRDAEGHWHALAARARILIMNTNRVKTNPPRSIRDLIDPRWNRQVGIAKPLFGTTATHAAVLFSKWGNVEAEAFFQDVQKNVTVFSGNKQVAQAVSSGQIAWGITDTDDAMVELDAGKPVRIVFPDQPVEEEDPDNAMGAMFVPNSICIIKNGPHPGAARRLVDFLLSADVERQLARGASAQFPLAQDARDTASRAAPQSAAAGAAEVLWLEPDFALAADSWDQASTFLQDTFATSQKTMHPVGVALTSLGCVLFVGGLFQWAPALLRDRRSNRLVFATIGLATAVVGWWLAFAL